MNPFELIVTGGAKMFDNDPFLIGIDINSDTFANEYHSSILDISPDEMGLALALADEIADTDNVLDVLENIESEMELSNPPRDKKQKERVVNSFMDENEDPETLYIRKYGDDFDG